MTTSNYAELSRLLADPDAAAAALYAAAAAVADEFDRVQLPGDAAQMVHDGLSRAGAAGNADAWLLMARVTARHDGPAASIDAFRLADRAGSLDGAVAWIAAAYHCRSADYAQQANERLQQLYRHRPDDPRLLLLIGYFAQQGYGCQADPGLAMQYFQAAADRGNADAAFELTVHLTRGWGVRADQAASDQWTWRAAELGSARAMANLGGMFAQGRGVAQDPRAALDWYARAAGAGHAKAAYTAGVMCLIGDGGLPVDTAMAQSWFDRARQLGYGVDDELSKTGLHAGRVDQQLYTEHLKAFSLNGFDEPRGVAVDEAANVYVVDQAAEHVVMVSAATGQRTVLPFVGLDQPEGVAVDAAGNVYVTDDGPAVLALNVTSGAQEVLPLNRRCSGGLLTADSAGNVYVPDGLDVVKLPIGTEGRRWDSQRVFSFDGLRNITAVAVDAAGDIYVTDPTENQVLKLDVRTGAQEVLGFTGLDLPDGIAVDSVGTVYVGDLNGVAMLNIQSGGQHALRIDGLSFAKGVAVDAADNVYVADWMNGRVAGSGSGAVWGPGSTAEALRNLGGQGR
ncbi:Serine/threonine-protein kinase [Mycolicibacterium fortuitum]|uniref:Serine/threonine-protein kinase n=1 Tax=Mycolicibacterium fortuitum TaxID=1766 RepID=A0A378WCJ1_MYCFO|nr:Serine/threonine-protein kinase [Mycolicibacterium fortuitum]